MAASPPSVAGRKRERGEVVPAAPAAKRQRAAKAAAAAAMSAVTDVTEAPASSGGGALPVFTFTAERLHPELYTAPLPTRDAAGRLHFSDQPSFVPNLTPEQVLGLGSFGGGYFRDITSGVTRTRYRDAWRELPPAWLEGLPKSAYASPIYDAKRNKYGVSCGQSLEAWEAQSWIVPQDPYGWFMWYCRFYQGRRTKDDERQISRWMGIAGPRGRWKSNLIAKVVAAGAEYGDASVSPVVRQTLQHWAYQLTKTDFEAHAPAVIAGARTSFIPGGVVVAKGKYAKGAAAGSAGDHEGGGAGAEAPAAAAGGSGGASRASKRRASGTGK